MYCVASATTLLRVNGSTGIYVTIEGGLRTTSQSLAEVTEDNNRKAGDKRGMYILLMVAEWVFVREETRYLERDCDPVLYDH